MKAHDAQQNLEYIKQVMQESRKTFVDNGSGFILWGLLVGLTFLLWYIVVVNEIPLNMTLVQLIAFGAGIVITVWGAYRESKSMKVETTSGKFLGAIWVGFLITLFLSAFIGFLNPIVVATMLGMACFASTCAPGFSLFRSLALIWWLGAIVLNFLWPDKVVLLIFGVMMLIFMALPGLIIYNRYRKELKCDVAMDAAQ